MYCLYHWHSFTLLCDEVVRKLKKYFENWLFVCIILQQCNCTHFQQCVDSGYDLKILVQNATYVTTLLSQSVYLELCDKIHDETHHKYIYYS